MKSLLLLALIAPALGQGGTGSDPYAGIDPDLITYPDDGIPYDGCFQDLVTADRNNDGVIKSNEYLGFIQQYGKRICYTQEKLTLKQKSAFITLSCRCQGKDNASPSCCLGGNAEIPTAGALDPRTRTATQYADLVAACRVTDGVMEGQRGCDPNIINKDAPPPFTFVVPTGVAAGATGGGGLSPGAIAGIVIGALAALLLFCCCCGFLIRRKKKKEAEEEELEKVVTTTEDLEQAPEQSPGNMDRAVEQEIPVVPVAAAAAAPVVAAAAAMPKEDEEDYQGARGGGNVEDEIDEEDIVAGRGSAKILPEDPDKGIPRWGGPLLPEEQPPSDAINLKPVDPNEPEENPDWDYPGRDINFPKDKDEMSAGEVEHYEPDGGVHIPKREGKEPLDWRRSWERAEVEDPDENDNRKHRIQAGLGEGEVWNKLGEGDEPEAKATGKGDVFDWVVQSALGVLGRADEAGHLDDKSMG